MRLFTHRTLLRNEFARHRRYGRKKNTHTALSRVRPTDTHRHTHIMNYIVSHGTCITVTVEHLCLIEDVVAVLVQEEGGLQEKVFIFFLIF